MEFEDVSSISRACTSLLLLFRERPKATLPFVPVPWLSLVVAIPNATAASAPSLTSLLSIVPAPVIFALLMTALTSRFRLFTPSAVPSAPLWALLLEAAPAPPVNQFTAAAPDQAPINTSSLAAFKSLPDPAVFPRVRFTLSMMAAVLPVTLFQLTLPATAALKLEADGLLLGAWIGFRLLKSQVFWTCTLSMSNNLSITPKGVFTRAFAASVT